MEAVLTGFRPVVRAASGAVMLSDAVALWRNRCAPLHLPALHWPLNGYYSLLWSCYAGETAISEN